MGGAPRFELNTPLAKVRRHLRYTLQKLRLRRWGGPWVALLAGEIKEVDAALSTELALTDAVDDAMTKVHAAAAVLDGLVRSAVDAGRHAGGYAEFLRDLFGDQTPSEFQDPVLGRQLAGMRAWPGYLKGHSAPLVQALVPWVETGLLAADDATAERRRTEAALINFRSLTQAALIKKVNGLFQQLLGEARKQAADDPGEARGLFLLTEQRRRRRAARSSLAHAEARVAACEQELAAARKDLAALQAAAAAESQAAAARAARAQRIAELRKQRERTDAEIAALEAKQK
ncbi:MAG: hypothetical protein U1A78_01920 [Polyangia bacterium]